uniref:uncharacterized protein LOC109951862 n=1 Tax=Monopterus albus TaxID=43700 RepID=UPI0009B41D88|nr:uncharacterized protein LOC109951862 [Monopterus albus]
MSLSATCESVSQKRTLSSLLAGRVVKRLKQEDELQLQEAAIQMLEQQQNLCSLFREVGNPDPCNFLCSQNGEQMQAAHQGISSAIVGSLLVCELRRQAMQLGLPAAALSVKMVLERLLEISGAAEEDEAKRRQLFTSAQRVQLCALLESSKELLSQGALCPKLLWQEYRRDQRLPKLEVVYHLHIYSILTLKYVLQSDKGVRSWLVSQLKALCRWTPPQGEEETSRTSCQGFWTLWTTVRRCSLLEQELSYASAEAVLRFFTHSLTQALTYKPRLTVSDAIALQNEWTFAKASCLLTCLLRKLAVTFSVELLLRHLRQVLETHEVNWKHVLCFLSTLLVYNPCAQPNLRALLSSLLSSAFEGYDLENMITAFLLARQGALEGPAVFPSYSDWFTSSTLPMYL